MAVNEPRTEQSHTNRAIQIALAAEANGIQLDPLRFIDLLDRSIVRDRWEEDRAVSR